MNEDKKGHQEYCGKSGQVVQKILSIRERHGRVDVKSDSSRIRIGASRWKRREYSSMM